MCGVRLSTSKFFYQRAAPGARSVRSPGRCAPTVPDGVSRVHDREKWISGQFLEMHLDVDQIKPAILRRPRPRAVPPRSPSAGGPHALAEHSLDIRSSTFVPGWTSPAPRRPRASASPCISSTSFFVRKTISFSLRSVAQEPFDERRVIVVDDRGEPERCEHTSGVAARRPGPAERVKSGSRIGSLLSACAADVRQRERSR